MKSLIEILIVAALGVVAWRTMCAIMAYSGKRAAQSEKPGEYFTSAFTRWFIGGLAACFALFSLALLTAGLWVFVVEYAFRAGGA